MQNQTNWEKYIIKALHMRNNIEINNTIGIANPKTLINL
jgi:hypothetical protein